MHAHSFSRLRRQLPLGGSLSSICKFQSKAFLLLKQTQLSASFVQREVARSSVTEGLFFLKSSAALPLCVILSGAKAESNP